MFLFQVADVPLQADLSGALYVPDTGTLIVSDLHLEKGSAFAARGIPLPPYDTWATLERVAEVVARLAPRTVVALGDSFHDRAAAGRLDERARARIRHLTQAADWLWLTGNHDPEAPADLGGAGCGTHVLGDLRLVHEPAEPPAAGEVAGHLHPKARLTVRGRHVTARCFVTDGTRLVMPAFGAYAGGLDVTDPVYGGLFPTGFSVLMLGRQSVHRLAGFGGRARAAAPRPLFHALSRAQS
ncbi:ligase-associated DNA damage response endonuclease PdeM [Zavarzinia sp. CC-PAN008]|uniref:ligase-associated DNA damage response endonuclease PdeM n=1 Tax=Zavarzinia sp. CC-PAN008 TaxID=3243332 RepID=UPI003F745C07